MIFFYEKGEQFSLNLFYTGCLKFLKLSGALKHFTYFKFRLSYEKKVYVKPGPVVESTHFASYVISKGKYFSILAKDLNTPPPFPHFPFSSLFFIAKQ